MNEETKQESDEAEFTVRPETSVTELENGIFTLVITLVSYYMNSMGLSKEVSSAMVAQLLERYVVALRSKDSQ